MLSGRTSPQSAPKGWILAFSFSPFTVPSSATGKIKRVPQLLGPTGKGAETHASTSARCSSPISCFGICHHLLVDWFTKPSTNSSQVIPALTPEDAWVAKRPPSPWVYELVSMVARGGSTRNQKSRGPEQPTPAATFFIFPDGQHFVMLQQDAQNPPRLRVVAGFSEEVSRLLSSQPPAE